MKKLLFSLLLIPNCLFAQKLERYCELVAEPKAFSTKVSISLDFGDVAGAFKDHRVRDEEGSVKKFNTLIDALNYMGTANWKLVNAYPIATGNVYVLHFFFRQEYDASELVTPPATGK